MNLWSFLHGDWYIIYIRVCVCMYMGFLFGVSALNMGWSNYNLSSISWHVVKSQYVRIMSHMCGLKFSTSTSTTNLSKVKICTILLFIYSFNKFLECFFYQLLLLYIFLSIFFFTCYIGRKLIFFICYIKKLRYFSIYIS